MSPVSILVVEDEILIAEDIKDLLGSFGMTDVFLAHTKEAALERINNTHPDVVILDLHLEAPLDGLAIARVIDEKYFIPYVFLTANADRLVIAEAVHTKAAAYITKPLKNSDFFAAIQIALKSKQGTEAKYLLVKNTGSTIRIPVSDILYIESNGNYIDIHTKKENILSRQSLEWAEDQLPASQFLRVHRSFLVNADVVSKLNSKSLYIEETEIPISRSLTAEVMSFFRNR